MASTYASIRSSGQLELTFDGTESVRTDLAIIPAGIASNSELAKAAGIHVEARGGIVVNRHLETEDPDIFAIGECALLDGKTHGLAAHCSMNSAASHPRPPDPSARALSIVSILALVAVTILAPPVAMADSVESFRYKLDQLWRDNLIKQITGYTLVGLFLIDFLLSLSKRTRLATDLLKGSHAGRVADQSRPSSGPLIIFMDRKPILQILVIE